MSYQLLTKENLKDLIKDQPDRFFYQPQAGGYLNLKNLDLAEVENIEFEKLQKYAQIIRAMIFTTVQAAGNGHPGGSSSKVEQWLALTLTGILSFDPLSPKNSARDRVVWSAGHCTPLLYAGQALYYEALRREGRQFSQAVTKNIFPEDLVRFRRIDGPGGHAESTVPYSDFSAGPSGHGFCAAGGMAISHKSCGLPTNVYVFMGDAESEEGMTYEARNVLSSVGADNLIVSLDFNKYGLDGKINEVISSDYIAHWQGLNWNVIEVDGHNLKELYYAYRLAKEKVFDNNLPTVVIAHTIKGKDYGSLQDSEESHGQILNKEEYIGVLKKLGFEVSGEKGNAFKDLNTILSVLKDEDEKYIVKNLDFGMQNILSENKLLQKMKQDLSDRPFISAIHLKRPEKLPPELDFKVGDNISTRQAFGLWLKWVMKSSAFVYTGAGDLGRSIMTTEAEKFYGLINKENPFGRGIKFGIAENNMAMMMAGLSADILPGGFRPISVFGTFGLFLNMASNSIRLATINNAVHRENVGFFIAVSSHDGPDTAQDGPTHQGMDNLSIFKAMPGIKVYKPNSALELIEMLFSALEIGEPIVLSLARPVFPITENSLQCLNQTSNGAYIYYQSKTSKKKKIVLVVSGMQILLNCEKIKEQLEKDGYSIKIVAVTSPELFKELSQNNPEKSAGILSAQEREIAITINNGYPEFLSDFIDGFDLNKRVLGTNGYLKSGTAEEIYDYAGLSPEKLYQKIKNILANV